MSEKADLTRGVRLGDYVWRLCPNCKIKNGVQVSLCSQCGKPLPTPIILPSFQQALENALHHALKGQVSIDGRGEISEVLKGWPQLAAYLKQSAAIGALDATITYGFHRLFTECDVQAGLSPDIQARLRPIRAFLDEQLKIAQRTLTRLRDQRLPNPLEALVKDYVGLFADYSREKGKIQADIGEGHITSSVDAAGKKLSSVLNRIDTLAQLLGPQGPLWGLYNKLRQATGGLVDSEWNAMLQAVNNIASFPLQNRSMFK